MRRLIARDEEGPPPSQEEARSEGPPPPEPAPPEPIPVEAPVQSPPSLANLRRMLEQWQAAVDERLRSVLPASADVEELKLEVRALSERLARLERRIGPRDGPEPKDPE
jgi:hypothetical protein